MTNIEFLQLAASDRKEVFIEVATQIGMTPFAVEKDWWVILDISRRGKPLNIPYIKSFNEKFRDVCYLSIGFYPWTTFACQSIH